MGKLVTALLVFFVGVGCSESPPEMPDYDTEVIFAASAYAPEWNERNLEIYRFLISKLDRPDAERIYFITHTPPSHWNNDVRWSEIPRDELDRFPNASLYMSANEAHLDDEGCVRQNETARQAWMQWISVRRWISDTEVEVETGVFTGPLGGGGQISVYEKAGDTWKLKSTGFSWVS